MQFNLKSQHRHQFGKKMNHFPVVTYKNETSSNELRHATYHTHIFLLISCALRLPKWIVNEIGHNGLPSSQFRQYSSELRKRNAENGVDIVDPNCNIIRIETEIDG